MSKRDGRFLIGKPYEKMSILADAHALSYSGSEGFCLAASGKTADWLIVGIGEGSAPGSEVLGGWKRAARTANFHFRFPCANQPMRKPSASPLSAADPTAVNGCRLIW